MKIIEYYMNNEWIRWILFIPLIMIINTLFMLFVHFVNIGFTDNFLFQSIFIPILGSGTTIFLTLLLAPRWHSGFCWLWISLTGIALLCGIFNVIMEFEGSSYRDIVQAGVWIVNAVFTKMHFEEDVLGKLQKNYKGKI